jgi:hypothetical protein
MARADSDFLSESPTREEETSSSQEVRANFERLISPVFEPFNYVQDEPFGYSLARSSNLGTRSPSGNARGGCRGFDSINIT